MIGGGGVPPQHRWSAQRWADGINLWPNTLVQYTGMFELLLDSYKYCYIYIKNCFENLKKNWKIEIIICGKHYFIKKIKTKNDVIMLSRFIIYLYILNLLFVLTTQNLHMFADVHDLIFYLFSSYRGGHMPVL